MRLRFHYVPYPKQSEAHRAPETHVLFAGGWGTGKTTWQVGEALRNAAWMPGSRGMLVSPTFPTQHRTLFPTITKILPGAKYWPTGGKPAGQCLGPAARDWSATHRVLTLWNGSSIQFASAKDPESMEGSEYDWGGLDEPRLVTHEAWRIFNSRIRSPSSRLRRRSVSGVPTMGWMYEEFGRPIAGRTMIRASTLDNPHLPPEYVTSLNISGRRAQAFIHGHFVHLEGSVYETYEPVPQCEGDHGSLLSVVPERGRQTFGTLDFGYRRPAFLVVQRVALPWSIRTSSGGTVHVLPAGTVVDVVVEEVVLHDVADEVHARECARMLKAYGLVLEQCWCDPAGTTSTARIGETVVQTIPSIETYERVFLREGVLAGSGLSWTTDPIERVIPNRIEATRARFCDHAGIRHLFVAEFLTREARTSRYDGVPGIHQSLLGYVYPENQPGNDRPSKDGVHDHFCDALEYLIVGLYGVMEGPTVDFDALDRASEGWSARDELDDVF